jgi:hypothetical protein
MPLFFFHVECPVRSAVTDSFEIPRHEVWAEPLKSLRSVTVRTSPKPGNAGKKAIIARAVTSAGAQRMTKIKRSTNGHFAPEAVIQQLIEVLLFGYRVG